MPTILVVDDSQVDRQLAGGLLGKLPNVETVFAADGAEAIAQVADGSIDLIVTDLQMPQTDGLELVRAVRAKYPHVPVILMTAFGSESLAVEALEAGAASYVPKSRMAQMLPNTIEEVLAITRAEQDYERLLARLHHSHSVFQLENDFTLFDPLIDLAQQVMAAVGICDATDRFRVGVALREALANACYHGNLELGFEEAGPEVETLSAEDMEQLIERRRNEKPYSERRIAVEWVISPELARYTIRDQGRGFDVSGVEKFGLVDVSGDATERGISLMRSLMDDVFFNQLGNEVTLIKRSDRP